MESCLKSQFIINNLLIYVQLASGTRKMHDIFLRVYALLWNHFYSFGPKFVDYQIFAGSWGRHFINNWFVALPCKTIQNTGKRAWGCKDVAKVNPEIHNILSPRTIMIPQYLISSEFFLPFPHIINASQYYIYFYKTFINIIMIIAAMNIGKFLYKKPQTIYMLETAVKVTWRSLRGRNNHKLLSV